MSHLAVLKRVDKVLTEYLTQTAGSSAKLLSLSTTVKRAIRGDPFIEDVVDFRSKFLRVFMLIAIDTPKHLSDACQVSSVLLGRITAGQWNDLASTMEKELVGKESVQWPEVLQHVCTRSWDCTASQSCRDLATAFGCMTIQDWSYVTHQVQEA